MSVESKPSLNAAKQDILLALFDHLHSASLDTHLPASKIDQLMSLKVSPQFLARAIQNLSNDELIENFENRIAIFRLTHAGILEAEKIAAAQRKIETDRVPVAEGVVSLNHNSAEVIEVRRALESLEDQVRTNNEAFPEHPDERQAALVEISALKTIWSGSFVRLGALRAQATSTLKWVSEKSSAAAIAEICKHIIKLIFGWP
ncbi:hypothetical protein AB5I39_02135 [Sphingomonas sp. MMS24-J45]|uniref:hypothetical protein n=1 Tax=Sphingomonas sp. MMS24-J45 TaxID=3238806 RepID=UPI00384C78D1